MASWHSNGLDLELAARRLSGPLIAGKHPLPWIAVATRAPAFALITVLVVAPAGVTVVAAVAARPWSAVGCGLLVVAAALPGWPVRRVARHGFGSRALWFTGAAVVAAAVAAVGLMLIAQGLTPDGRRAYALTLAWVAFAVVLVVSAVAIAWYTRAVRWLWQVMIVPFGISAFSAGIAFRLMFDRVSARFDFGGVTAYQIAFGVMLALAFAWTWLGMLSALFRAAIQAIDDDPVRAGYLEFAGSPPRMVRLWRLVRPVRLIALLVVGVAAARVFDAILAAVPGSMQYRLDSATVYWWRASATCTQPCGDAAAYALPLALVVGLVAYWAQAGIRAHQVSWSAPAQPGPEAGRERMGMGQTLLVGVLAVAALLPIAVLAEVAFGTSSRSVRAGFDALAHDSGLWRALSTSAWVAGLATLIVVLVTVPVAHRLAALRSGFAARIVVPCLVVLTVLPAQMYLGPLQWAVQEFGLYGTRVPLILTHAAAGLPIAILVVRGALLAPAYTPAADALYGLAPRGAITARVFAAVRPALGAVAVLEFVQVWNDFFLSLMISGPGASPWSLLLWNDTRQFAQNSPHLAAGALVSASVPVALLMVFWRRWLVPGLAGGALR